MSAESVIIYRNMHCTSNFMQEEHFYEKGDIIITAIDMDLYALSYKKFVDCIDISEVLQHA